MGIKDFFRADEYKSRAEELRWENDRLRSYMTPEMQNAENLSERILNLQSQIKTIEPKAAEVRRLEGEIESLNRRISSINSEIAAKENQIVDLDSQIAMQDFGLYKPRFDFANSTQFKDRLKICRDKQKNEVKMFDKMAERSPWTVNGSNAQGRKMVRQTAKLLMRAYNGECDEIVRKVRTSNVMKSIERIYSVAQSVNRQAAVIGISIPASYQALKEEEVRLAYEFQQQKEREKEEIREAREREREERKLAKEIAEKRKKLEKEKKQYLTAYKDIDKRLKSASEEEKPDLIAKEKEIKAKLEEVDVAVQDVDYREANQKAGYVYVISNIGSFGEGVYKIGMTRRLDPMERVRELGDASVPFNFDVHAMIFSDDAPKLEAALHREFEDKKINIVNQRREFFRVSLKEIERVVRANYEKTVEFTEAPDAGQYRTSEKLREQGIYEYRR